MLLFSFSLLTKILIGHTSKVKSSLISSGTWDNTRVGSNLAFLSNNMWNTSCIFDKCGGKVNLYATGPIF
jgi:hypothetical protein